MELTKWQYSCGDLHKNKAEGDFLIGAILRKKGKWRWCYGLGVVCPPQVHVLDPQCSGGEVVEP